MLQLLNMILKTRFSLSFPEKSTLNPQAPSMEKKWPLTLHKDPFPCTVFLVLESHYCVSFKVSPFLFSVEIIRLKLLSFVNIASVNLKTREGRKCPVNINYASYHTILRHQSRVHYNEFQNLPKKSQEIFEAASRKWCKKFRASRKRKIAERKVYTSQCFQIKFRKNGHIYYFFFLFLVFLCSSTLHRI